MIMFCEAANFQKVSYGQFEKDFKKKFGENYTDDDVKEIYEGIKLPTRATIGSAGHDISIPFSIAVAPTGTIMIPTGLRCEMLTNYVMLVFPRSSLAIKKGLQLVNQTAVIDSDYAGADNEGHIFICLKNVSSEVVHLEKGENIVQAVFLPYGVTVGDNVEAKRTGGIGSTNN